MNKILAMAVMAAALAVLTGCIREDDYDQEASRKQLVEECKTYGGVLQTYRFGNSNVQGNPWVGNCINPTTGNQFKAFAEGVRK